MSRSGRPTPTDGTRRRRGLPWGALAGGALLGAVMGGLVLSNVGRPPGRVQAGTRPVAGSGEDRARPGEAWRHDRARLAVPPPALRASTPVAPAQRSAQAAPAPADVRQAMRDYERRWEGELAQHASAARDAGWAHHKETELKEALEDHASAQAFSLESVDCRQSTCVASLQFPSYDDAVARYDRVLPYYEPDHPCALGTNVFLPVPGDRRQPYRVTFLYTCGR